MIRIIYFTLIALFLNACIGKDGSSESQGNTKTSNEVQQSQKKELSKAELLADFKKRIVEIPVTKLPYSIGENFLLTTKSSYQETERKLFFDLAGNSKNSFLNAENSFFKLSAVKNDSLLKYFPIDQNIEKTPLLLAKRLPPLGNIERLIYSSAYEHTGAIFWTLITFDLKSGEIVDQAVVAIFEGMSDTYYKSGFYINKKYEIKSAIYAYYDAPGILTERKMAVTESGEIVGSSESKFDIGIEETLRDYQQDYKISDNSLDSKTDLSLFANSIPVVEFPYSTSSLDSYFQVASPMEDGKELTRLMPDQLKGIKPVAQVGKINDELKAFQLTNASTGTYETGNYYYPVFSYKRNEKVRLIAYLFQSFCNYHPTIFLKLCSYDQQGNEIDAMIVSRNFFSGELKFTDRVTFNPDFTIDIFHTIQNYEELVNGTSSKITERSSKESIVISETGKINKTD